MHFKKKKGGYTMKRLKNSQMLIGILTVFAVCFMYPQTSLAHSPNDVKLSYDSQSQMLDVTITHKSPFPSTHYIKSVEIKKNGSVVSTDKYENQPDQATYTYSYKVPATAGETLEVKASCNLYGSKTTNLTVEK
jgi:desulfoferrodoxin (superoxide reductase-like protein)